MRELLAHVALQSQMSCDDQFAKKEETCVSSACAAEMLLATDHVWNASRLVSAVESLCTMHVCVRIEDGSHVDCLVAAVDVAGDDVAEDGLSGHKGNVGLLPDAMC
jgi:hypothetical protein